MVNKTLVIAEIGVNHDGKILKAKKLIKVAARAGADIVKFQIFRTENLVTKEAKKAQYQLHKSKGNRNQFQMLKKLELSEKDFFSLKRFCDKQKVEFCASCFDLDSSKLLKKLNPKRIKIPSGEITNFLLLKKLASFKKKIILSTGMSNLREIKESLKLLLSSGSKLSDITLMQCNTEYPTPLRDANLKVIEQLKENFKINVGYSDHTRSIETPIAAVALGAKVIEKHLTLNRKSKGPDHKASLIPQEFAEMVKSIRNVEIALGKKNKTITNSEKKNIKIVRKSIVASQFIRKNQKFSLENVTAKRSGIGISPMNIMKVVNKKAKKNFKADEIIKL